MGFQSFAPGGNTLDWGKDYFLLKGFLVEPLSFLPWTWGIT